MDNPLIHRMQGFATTIFAEMTTLAVQHDAINLGQGFPDTGGPQEVLDAAKAAMDRGENQYAPGLGVPELREAVAHHQRAFYGIDLDPATQVMASAGATEAMTASILALCEAGDEVVVLEPTYDCYEQATALAGGVLKRVRLHEPAYSLDADELRAAVTDRTKLLIINSPHNPTGHVLTAEELASIAEIAIERDLVVLCDDVYEHLTFDARTHTPLATLPGMFDRTVTISSAGKTFSVTGWKIGWLTGPARLLQAIHTVKQNMTYTNGTPFQFGVAAGLRLPKDRFAAICRQFVDGRDRLVPGLEAAGLDVHPAEGSYFVMTDIRPLGFDDGYEFCRMLPGKIGVAAIPAQVFYADPATARHLVRFTFAKQHEVLDEAAKRLATLG
ncbi:pyridoxal phosphate-dependent aminotransferase [Mariniluteicoccus flavus]